MGMSGLPEAAGDSTHDEPLSFLDKARLIVTVEPAAFLFDAAFMFLLLTDEQYVYNRILETYASGEINMTSNGSATITEQCGQIPVESDIESKAEADAATFMTIYSVLIDLPSILSVFLWGSYSDSVGRKKALILPALGSTLHVFISILVSSFDLNLNVVYLGCLIDGLFGGSALFRGTVFAYIADVTNQDNRTQRTAVLQAMIVFGLAISQILSGFSIEYMGFLCTYIVTGCVSVLCLSYVTFWVKESVQDFHKVPFFRWEHVKKTVMLLFKDDGTGTLWKLQVGFAILFVSNFVSGGSFPFLIIFVIAAPLCFSAPLAGGFLATCNLLNGFGVVAALYIFHRFLRDFSLLIIACVAAVAGYAWLAMPFLTDTLVFLTAVILFMSGGIAPITRSILSKATSPDKQGTLSAGLVVCIEISLLLGNAIFGPIYSGTVAFYKGFIWIVASCLLLVPFLLAVYLSWRNKRETAGTEPTESTKLTE